MRLMNHRIDFAKEATKFFSNQMKELENWSSESTVESYEVN